MNITKHFFLAIVLLAVGIIATAAKPPKAEALKIDQPPVFDGLLNETFWKQAKPLDKFFKYSKDKDKNGQLLDGTIVKLAYDSTWLYIGIECENQLQELILSPNTVKHDGQVHRDESVEIFLDPGTKGKLYYHFSLSCFNIKAEQRVRNGSRERVSWNQPWRTATKITPKGWTAEIAVPLYLVLSYGDFKKMRFNIIRNRRCPFKDAQQVVTHETIESSSWSPVIKSFHEPSSFGYLAPLTPGQVKVPFMVSLEKITVLPYAGDDGKISYGIEAEIKGANFKNGEIKIIVADTPAGRERRQITNSFQVKGTKSQKISIRVPVNTLAERKIDVLAAMPSGEEIQRVSITNPPELQIMDAWLDRNYYTTEKTASATVIIGMPPASLKDMTTLVQIDGRIVAQSPACPETAIPFSVAELKNGTTKVKIQLRLKSDKPFFSRELNLEKLPSKPGREWKINQRDRVVMHDGKPFFPMGPVMSSVYPDDEGAFKYLQDNGFNTFFHWMHNEVPEAEKYLELCNKYDLKAIFRLEGFGWARYKDANLVLPGKYLNAKEARSLNNNFRRGSVGIRAAMMFARSGSRKQRGEIFCEYYHKMLPNTVAMVNRAKTNSALLGYNSFDEPCDDRFFDITTPLLDLYKTVRKNDRYHPVMLLYSSHIPIGDKYVAPCDILSTDPYWVPDGDQSKGLRGSVNFVSKIVALNDARAKKFRKAVWIMPMAFNWSGTRKRGISAAEQNCQSFLAVIHGARGLFWFSYPMPASATSNLRETVKKLKIIIPSVLNRKPQQSIGYSSRSQAGKDVRRIELDPHKNIFPDVQAKVFRDPEDDALILVAANSCRFPVAVKIKVKGINNRTVTKMLTGQSLPVNSERFSEKLEPFAVRAYKLGKLSTRCAYIDIETTRPAKIPPLAKSLKDNYQKGKRNLLPNPSFEETTVANMPDYYFGNIEIAPATKAKFGEKCVKITNPKPSSDSSAGLYGQIDLGWFAPRLEAGAPCVFSFYGKGEKDSQLSVKGDKWHTIKLTPEWQLYSVTLTAPKHNANIRIQIRTSRSTKHAWLDGLQFEVGDAPTAFQD